MGGGLKESLLAGLLASHGKTVLQLDDGATASAGSLDLQELAELTEGAGVRLSEQKVGAPSEYSIERAPKMFIASGTQLQMLVASGAWQHMNPPGFKRVHRSLMYRRRADGNADVHRVLANSEDVLKTRSLATLDKARVVQFFLWIDRYDESDPRTHATGPLSKVGLGSGQRCVRAARGLRLPPQPPRRRRPPPPVRRPRLRAPSPVHPPPARAVARAVVRAAPTLTAARGEGRSAP